MTRIRKEEKTDATSPKSNADSKAHGHSTSTTKITYSQATAQGGSTRTMTSASTTARRGTAPSLQIDGPPGLTPATSSTSTNQSTTSRQPNSGTDSPTERQSIRNGYAANPSHRQPDTNSRGYQPNRNGSETNPPHRQPDTSRTGYHPNRNGSEANPAHRQTGTTYL
jgi:hypothetical protein